LTQALQYIKASAFYQQEHAIHDKLSSSVTAATELQSAEFAGQTLDAGEDIEVFQPSWNGGHVRSEGGAIKVRPGTNLARLIRALGNRVGLLDTIPSIPITIEAQDIFPTYFPFRLHLGFYHSLKVYVYLTLAHQTTKILAHTKDGKHLSWLFYDLRELELLQPFALFIGLGDSDLRTRGNKIRYFVYYYFMLAENAGITGDPQLRGSTQIMVPSFCAACRGLEEARCERGVEKLPEMLTDAPNSTTENTSRRQSLIVKLHVNAGVLSVLSGASSTSHVATRPERIEKPNRNRERNRSEEVESEIGYQSALADDMLAPSIQEQELNNSPQIGKQQQVQSKDKTIQLDQEFQLNDATARSGSRDSGFESSYVSLATPGIAAQDAITQPQVEESIGELVLTPMEGETEGQIGDMLEEAVTELTAPLTEDVPNDDQQDTILRPYKSPVHTPTILSTVVSDTPDHETRFVRFRRASSTFSILSNRDDDVLIQPESSRPPSPPAEEEKALPPNDQFAPSEIIDLCSDDEDEVVVDEPRRVVESIPDAGELRLPPARGTKRELAIVIDDTEEVAGDVDGDVKEVVAGDEDTWKRASQRQAKMLWRD
jgi:hypothetical protein